VDKNSLVLEAQGLKKIFRAGDRTIEALKGVDVQVRSGMVTGLIGPDAAGKSTFMRLAAGLMKPSDGSVYVLGLDAAAESQQIHEKIAYMPQRFGLYEDLTVQENLDLYADLQLFPRTKRKERYKRLMEMTGLAPFMDRLAGRLSGGMKQKLGLACCLIRPPEFLILDEPTVGVDPVSRRELWEIVYSQVDQLGMSVLVSTAYLDEAERCSRVVLLHDGRIIGSGKPGDFSAKMAGRVFLLNPARKEKRILQLRLSQKPQVVDALIQGDRIRLVMSEQLEPDQVGSSLSLPDQIEITPVEPRFEDAFIYLLRQKGDTATEVREAENQGEDIGLGIHKPVQGSRTDVVIDVQRLTKRFGEFYAVREITFQVRRGEIFGLLGANGAGKSTTFRMLCGLLPPTSGKLLVAGCDMLTAGPAAKKMIGYMAQKFSLYEDLTSRENLEFFSHAYGLSGRVRQEKIAWAMDAFGLEKVAGVRSRNLPLGFKQRLSLAAALMHEPDVLFLDEPTSGVDPVTRREFWRHINVLAEAKVTIMVTTHFLEEAEYCDRLVIMADGTILDQGTPDEVRRRCSTEENPSPTMEDAFIFLIQREAQKRSLVTVE